MLVSWRSITLPFKKTSEVEVCTWGSQIFWKFLSESCSTHGWCELSRRMESWAREWLGWPKQLKLGDEVHVGVMLAGLNIQKDPKGTTNSESFRTCFFFQITEAYFRTDELRGKFSKGNSWFHPHASNDTKLFSVAPCRGVPDLVHSSWTRLFLSAKSKASIVRILSPPRKLGA